MDSGPNRCTRLNIIQWNAQSLRPKLLSFEQILFKEHVHIASLQETWIESGSPLHIKGYTIYRRDRPDSYGGVAIVVHNSVVSSLQSYQPINPNIEVIVVKISNCSHINYVLSIYCAPSVRTNQADWEHLFNFVDRRSIILGDLNGHHSNWSHKIDSRGLQIHDALLESKYITLNMHSSSTRVKLVNNILQQSSPDLSIASSDIAIRLNWKTLNETLGSDHLIIKITTYSENNTDGIQLRRNYKRADWESYTNLLHILFDDYLYCPHDPQKSYDNFVSCINEAADRFIPYKTINYNPSSKFVPRPYWQPFLSKSIAERRLALSTFRRNPTPDNLKKLQEKISDHQKLSRQTRDKGFHDFCSSLDRTTTSSVLWQKLKWLKGYKSPRFRPSSDKVYELLYSLTPDYVLAREPVFLSYKTYIDHNISRQELDRSMTHKDTAPGCDQISYSMLSHLPENGKSVLLMLYNLFYDTSFVPTQWRDIMIVPIPKPSRDPEAGGSLRPISMISCLCKVFHSILLKRLEWYMESNNLFTSKTTGFRRCRSTIDNLACLVSRIQTGFSEDKITLASFIDINNAYNDIDINSLINTMQQLGISSMMCRYLWNFLKERYLKTRIDTRVICRSTCRGLAQGDPFSPLLFNIATINICKSINNVYISQYADDFVLYAICDSLQESKINLQYALNDFMKLLFNIGLEISSLKSKVCTFKRGYKTDSIDISIHGRPLEVVDNIKYLGVWLDRSLRWAKHINELRNSCNRLVNVFKALSGSGWGIHPTHLRRVYIAMIRSKLDYASSLYGNSCKTHLSKLDRLQNQCMRVIGGFIKSTAIHVMESELHLQPLRVRRCYLAGKFWLKSKSFSDNGIVNILDRLNISCRNPYWHHKAHPLLVQAHAHLHATRMYTSDRLEM